MLAIRSNRDEFSLLIPYVRFTRQTTQEAPLLVDTNIIIDGRVQAVCARRASSAVRSWCRVSCWKNCNGWPIRATRSSAERGRRGFDNLEKMRRTAALDVTIHDNSTGEARRTRRGARRRAAGQSGALSPEPPADEMTVVWRAWPGCKISPCSTSTTSPLPCARRSRWAMNWTCHLVKEGRDANQAVGYLPDGTMIVVNTTVARTSGAPWPCRWPARCKPRRGG